MSLFSRVVEGSDPGERRLTNAAMSKMVPMFVKSGPDVSHNCAGCSMFVAGERCTVVAGKINGDRGTCNFWAGGPNASADKIHDTRMRKETAGYVEAPAGMKIQCGSCEYLARPGYCGLWQGGVSAGDCCVSWDHPKAT